MHTKPKPSLLYLLFCLIALSLSAQDPTGNLEGSIADEAGQPLIGANVVLSSPDLQGLRGTTTDENGLFRMLALPVGSYTLNISYVGYSTLTIKDVLIQLGKTTTVGEVQLALSSEQIDDIVVLGNPPALDPATTALGEHFSIQTIDRLPVDRDFSAVVALAPQAAQSFYYDGGANLSGSTGLENLYFIDGVHVTDPISGSGGTYLPYNFIREIQVRTGGYEAEYRSALGGIIDVVTHSGGNELHGQAFSFLSGDFLQSEPKLTSYQTNVNHFVQADAGLGLGGPVIKDKLWFYAAYNYLREQKGIELIGAGEKTDKFERHAFASKLTWRVDDQSEMVFTAFGDPATHDIIGNPTYTARNLLNIDPMLGYAKTGGVNLSLRFRRQFGERFLLTTALSSYQASSQRIGQTETGNTEPLFYDFTTATLSGGYGYLIDDRARRLAAKVTGTVLLRDHAAKAGLEFENNRYDKDQTWDVLPGGLIYQLSNDLYQAYYGTHIGTLRNRIPAVFLQDSWQISKQVRLNAGLRWSAQYIMGSDGKLAQRITDEIQPRLGLIYQPGSTGTHKVFASYGRFYEQLPGSFMAVQFNEFTDMITYFAQDPRESIANGDSTNLSRGINPEVKGLHGQYYDEFSLGYEQLLGKRHKLDITGTYRAIGEVVEDFIDFENGGFVFGNPGRGNMSDYPRFSREYLGLELSLRRFGDSRFNYLFSYLLSRNYGNYPGLYDSYVYFEGLFNPNLSRQMDVPAQFNNSRGLLPNDRTHILKFNGSYQFDFGLSVGTTFSWMTGTPLTELGSSGVGPPVFVYLSQRGDNGRTPNIYDLNFRVTYDLNKVLGWSGQPRLIADFLHIGNPRQPVWFDEVHYNAVNADGEQIAENPSYMEPRAYQPPMTIRLGFELGF